MGSGGLFSTFKCQLWSLILTSLRTTSLPPPIYLWPSYFHQNGVLHSIQWPKKEDQNGNVVAMAHQNKLLLCETVVCLKGYTLQCQWHCNRHFVIYMSQREGNLKLTAGLQDTVSHWSLLESSWKVSSFSPAYFLFSLFVFFHCPSEISIRRFFFWPVLHWSVLISGSSRAAVIQLFFPFQ